MLLASVLRKTSLSLNDAKAVSTPPQCSLIDTIHSVIVDRPRSTDPFYTLHLGHLTRLVRDWAENLPLVQPFFAVKCNPTPCFLAALAAHGVGFDCASQLEIDAVLALGLSPDRIVYANPCKPESHVKYAANVGVNLTTFDSANELDKIRKLHPASGLLIRIKAPDEDGARFRLGSKFGAFPEEIVPLLVSAQAAGLSVVGVSFHVGSDTKNFSAYGKAIAAARSVFDAAVSLGMPPMTVLDIGGGFTAGPSLTQASRAVMEAIRTHFPGHDGSSSGLKIIAEPGRYFAASAFTLAANVIGKRVRGGVREYWINDGVYGSMNRRMCDFGSLQCLPLACGSNRANPGCEGTVTYCSTVFGPTCDSADTVLTEYELPELEVGDWLLFPKMGAYSAASVGCNFNGFKGSDIKTYVVG